MGVELTDLLNEVRRTRDTLASNDTATTKRIDGLEKSLNDLIVQQRRPGGSFTSDSEEANRRAAIGLLRLKHHLMVPKIDPQHLFPATPSEDAINEARNHIAAIKALMHTPDHSQLSDVYRKSLSSFSFGSNGFILPPTMSDKILSCTAEQTDVTGLMGSVTIANGSIKFLVDNGDLDSASWGCDAHCFANSPNSHDLASLLSELEIKPDPLRYIVCASGDILADAAIDIESWMIGKVTRAFKNTVSSAVMMGDGLGKPLGILTPQSGIPICDTSVNTPANQFSWQDLVMLRWQVPMQWQDPASAGYIMNQRTAALCLTMSDANGRPIMQSLQESPTFTLMGAPLRIVTQMPDVAPGSTPVAYGNWKETYTLVNRKAVTMQSDPYSAGFCHLFKFEARIGGAVTCPNAARLLRVQ